ncbi:hypothetical protein FNV43_RR26115 [Rhamnella rubrinervis]|uniref:glutathione transferase n=1 Tax=Rhamnella rubrinervis TaxID=2594499 RepID=A0A8K0DNG6_9ROSA|nr:hypothetical protein FNV43_RR26115 [Rhamnella rubrinervis]
MAESTEVKLLGLWPSTYALRARIALNIKQVNYAFLEENLGAKSELLLKSNPVHMKVPVLLHGDKPICESLIIVQYIDDVWTSGPSMPPSHPYDRAIARFWAAYIDEKWGPTTKAIDAVIVAGEGEEAKKAAVDKVYDILVLLEEAFKKCSKGKAFFGGDRMGYLDMAFGSCLGWLRFREKLHDIKLLDPAKTPQLVKWAERFCEHPAVVGVMPETEQLATIEYGKGLIAKVRGANPSKW